MDLRIFYEAPLESDGGKAPDGVFKGPESNDPRNKPVVVYPLEGALHPVNFRQMTLQWKARDPLHYFVLDFKGEYVHQAVTLGSGQHCALEPNSGMGRCFYSLSDRALSTLAQSAAGGEVQLTIKGSDDTGDLVSTSEPFALRFSPEPAEGTLYFAAKSSLGIRRKTFNLMNLETERFLAAANGDCIGCHAVSRDGTRVALTAHGYDGVGAIVDTATEKYLRSPDATPPVRWNSATFSPDGRTLLTGWAGQLTLRDATTGARKRDIDMNLVGGRAIQPDWSPDGKHVVFVRLPPDGKLGGDFMKSPFSAGDWVAGNTGDIVMMDVSGDDFQAARVVVQSKPGVEYHYAPSWSPDSAFVLFLSATAPASSPAAWSMIYGNGPVPPAYRDYVMTYGQVATRMRLVAASGGMPIELTAATRAMDSSVAMPRFATLMGEQLALITFASRLPYGFVVEDGSRSQIWVAGIDLERAARDGGATDPSFPPVWFPYQDPRDSNFAGYWR